VARAKDSLKPLVDFKSPATVALRRMYVVISVGVLAYRATCDCAIGILRLGLQLVIIHNFAAAAWHFAGPGALFVVAGRRGMLYPRWGLHELREATTSHLALSLRLSNLRNS
jgi:hypothetical protein